MKLIDLKQFLDNSEIPTEQNRAGFLEIIGKQSHENINSAIYAHFINSSEAEVRYLFLNALSNLIEKKTNKSLDLINAYASTEVSSGNGRIDILVKDFRSGHSVIIENKLFHGLNNPLREYWDSVRSDDRSKVGVLLTLRPQSISIETEVVDKFINITHLEWLESVEDQYNEDLIPEHYRIYIFDFINTIKSLSTKYKMNESSRFYFQNSSQIQRANATMHEAHNFINTQLQMTADQLGWSVYGNSMEWRNIWDSVNKLDTYLTVVTKDLLQGEMSVMIIVELFREDLGKEEAIRLKFSDHPQWKDKTRGKGNKWYQHLLCKSYVISEKELEDLSGFLLEKIREDFALIMFQIIAYLYPDKDFTNWSHIFLGTLNE